MQSKHPSPLLVLVLLTAFSALPTEAFGGEPVLKSSDVITMYQGSRDTYDAYGINVLAWGGTPSRRSLDEAAGLLFFGSVGMVTEFAKYYERFPQTYEEGLCRDVDNQPIKVPWLTDHSHKGIPFWWCCTNQPNFRTFIRERVTETVRAGAQGQHIDDHLGSAGAVHHGGCFCDRCLAGFHAFVKELPKGEQERFGIGDPDTFDYRKLVREWKNSPEGTGRSSWHQPLFQLWLSYHLREAAAFMLELRELAASVAGKPVPMSANAGLLHYPHTVDYRALDFFSAEIDHEAEKGYLSSLPIFAYRLADGLGRPLAATASGQDWAFVKEHSATRLVQRWIALGYASGNYLMTPHRQWCYTSEKGTHWYDGPTEAYAPLYRFVRDHADLFDGFETAADLTLVFSQASYRRNDDLKRAGRTLSAAGLSYNLAVAGDRVLDHPLPAADLERSARLLALDDLALEEADASRLANRCAQPSVECFDSLNLATRHIQPAAKIIGSGDYFCLPRRKPGRAVIHLVSRVPGKGSPEGDEDRLLKVRFDSRSLGLEKVTEVLLYQPGSETLSVDYSGDGKLSVPAPEIWGIVLIR